MSQEVGQISTSSSMERSITQQGAVAPPQKRGELFKHLLEDNKSKLSAALAKRIDVDRFVSAAIGAARLNPQLMEADGASMLSSLLQCAQLGLTPNVLGEAYLVPFRNGKKQGNPLEVQLIVGYQGLITLIRRSGYVTSINAQAVYARDEFAFRYGLNEQLDHVPSTDSDRGEILFFYAYAKFKDGGHAFEVMPRSEVEKIRARSKGSRSEFSPWTTDFEAMGRKTVIRRLSKYLPKSVDLIAAESVDAEAVERGVLDPVDMGLEALPASQEITGAQGQLSQSSVDPASSQTTNPSTPAAKRPVGRPKKEAAPAAKRDDEIPIDKDGNTIDTTTGEVVPVVKKQDDSSEWTPKTTVQTEQTTTPPNYEELRRRALEKAGINPNRQAPLGFE